VLKFVHAHLGGAVPEPDRAAADLPRVAAERAAALVRTGAALGACEFRAAAEAFLGLGRFGNQLFDAQAPWKLRKESTAPRSPCATSLFAHVQILATLSTLMAPFMPGASARLRRMLALPDVESWTLTGLRAPPPGAAPTAPPDEVPAGHALGDAGILFSKIAGEVIERERAALAALSAAT
jgi:methionyl-tRNA synthetase